MIGILIVSHGRLSEALIDSIEYLVGNLKGIRGISIRPKDTEEEVRNRIQEEIQEVDDGDGVLILMDIPGGTFTNLSQSFLQDEKIEIVTGVNVPMLLTLSSYRKGRSLMNIGRMVKNSGRRSIILAKQVHRVKKSQVR